MDWIREDLHASVREGYQILLRAECALFLPVGYEKIADYYRAVGQKCLSWVTEVHGERLRACFADAASVREKAAFGTAQYRFCMRCTYADDDLLALVCDTTLTGHLCEETMRQRRLSAVWLLLEETLLPHEQILSRFSLGKRALRVGFVPDGVYPDGEEMVLFKNAREGQGFCERWVRLPR